MDNRQFTPNHEFAQNVNVVLDAREAMLQDNAEVTNDLLDRVLELKQEYENLPPKQKEIYKETHDRLEVLFIKVSAHFRS